MRGSVRNGGDSGACDMQAGAMHAHLASADVHVWWMASETPAADDLARWRASLDAAECTRADRFHFATDRSTYMAAHWLLRNALASVGGLPAQEWRFVSGRHGKPAIDPALGRPDLAFNLSHTRRFVACAIGCHGMIGIDIEELSRRPDLDIADNFFSPSEVAFLRRQPRERQHETFLRFWTLKEALIKATGEGLHRPLDSFSFSLDPVSIAFHPGDGEEAAKWAFHEIRPTPRHLLALALRRAGPPGAVSYRFSRRGHCRSPQSSILTGDGAVSSVRAVHQHNRPAHDESADAF
jgi:4'-phosphopantetheinyl transferase